MDQKKNVKVDVEKISKYVYATLFIAAQVVGLVLTVIGLVTVVKMSQQKFGLTNLKPLFQMISGIVFAIVGVILIGVSYTIRWKHRVIKRLEAIEKALSLQEAKAAEDEEPSVDVASSEPASEQEQ
ncbi:MAG: hypothetical protein MJ057_04975 [Sphaerochaetaceae bacterium]|nr:hypothetical protein [Sphaerochaetaceae bacterium]